MDNMFHKITIKDREWITERLNYEHLDGCDFSFANIYIWKHLFETEACEINGCCLLKYRMYGKLFFCFPFGSGRKTACIDFLKDYCKKQGLSLTIKPVLKEQKKWLTDNYPGEFEITEVRDEFDYMYNADDLAYLKGRHFHSKRNHIHNFIKNYDWEYEPLTTENIQECLEIEQKWLSSKECITDEILNEKEAVCCALEEFQQLGLSGGILKVNGKGCAFSIYEPLNQDTAVVHIEKGLRDFEGIYAMINQQTALRICDGYKYINREDDAGEPGIRKAKLSYQPVSLIEKYQAEERKIVFARVEDKDCIRQLWKKCFSDGDFFDFYFINRFTESNMVCIWEDRQIVCMASIFPCRIMSAVNKSVEQEAVYVYAVGTDPDYRRKGYAKRLLRWIKKRYGNIYLKPSNAENAAYYKKLGFHEVLKRKKTKGKIDIEYYAGFMQYQTVTEELALKFRKIRRQKLQEQTRYPFFVSWSAEELLFALKDHIYSGGKILMNDTDFLLYVEEDKVVRVVDSTVGFSDPGTSGGHIKDTYYEEGPIMAITDLETEEVFFDLTLD